jgi:hypothetical protein
VISSRGTGNRSNSEMELSPRSTLERAAIAARRHAGNASEDTSQMMLVGKAARECHLSQRQAMVAHQGLCPPDALMKQILVRRLSCALAEAANEVR